MSMKLNKKYSNLIRTVYTWCAFSFFVATPIAIPSVRSFAQSPEKTNAFDDPHSNENEMHLLRQEIALMRANYEAHIHQLESRLDALQKKVDEHEVAVVQEKPDYSVITEKLLSEGNFDWREFDDRMRSLEDRTKQFGFFGYFRAGYGLNGKGGTQQRFEAPGALQYYRLGNETNNLAELEFDYYWHDPRDLEGMTFDVITSFSWDAPYSKVGDPSIAMEQAYVKGHRFMKSSPETSIWAGKRYYLRRNAHIYKLDLVDMSGIGAGIQDLAIGDWAKLDIALIGGPRKKSDPNDPTDSINYKTNHGLLTKSNLDCMLHDIEVPGGKLSFWGNLSASRGGREIGTNDKIKSAQGFGLGILHDSNPIWGGDNWCALQYGYGSSSNFEASLAPVNHGKLDKSWAIRFSDILTVEPWDHYALQGFGLYQLSNDGGRKGNRYKHLMSLGGRGIYSFTKHINLALEAGLDHVNSQFDKVNGQLYKFTIAPELASGDKFFSRPVLRTYFTWAHWTKGFKGKVGGETYKRSTHGIASGVQVETWW